MNKADRLIRLIEDLDDDAMKAIENLNKAFIKAGFDPNIRTDLGNTQGKLYRITKGSNGEDYALFRVPVITSEKGQSTQDRTLNAENSLFAFNKIINTVWGLRNQGYYLSQPVGGKVKGDAWGSEETTSGNVMTFWFGK